MRPAGVRLAARRVGISRVLLILPFLMLAGRAAHLAVVDERGVALGDAQSRRTLTLAPERGTLYDRTGVELAMTVDAPSIYAVPADLENPAADAAALARALGLRPAGVVERLGRGRSFRFVARWVTPEAAARVRELDLRGVGIIEEPRRRYPHRQLAAKVVGFANIDGDGVRGIEQQEDRWLRGTPRSIRVERDARGRLLVGGTERHWRTTGGDVALTLDANLQADAYTALIRAVESTGARGGVVLTMDPRTGDVLALAEAPSFDPNGFRTLEYATTRARAFLDALDPGSTLKAFLVAAALERGAIDVHHTFDCTADGAFRVPGKIIRDRRPFGVLDAGGMLRVSSNICAVKIAYALGPRAHFEMLRRFGFGERTGSGFPDESAGVLRGWKQWQPLDHATIAFGQGISVTTIQLAAALAAVANGGELLRPKLVRARRAADTPWRPAEVDVVRRVLRPETAATVLGMLEQVVSSEGTGRLAALRGVRVAGKTGTAQKLDPQGGYSDDRYVAWFAGIAPVDDPRLVIVAALDEPRRPHHTGGSAAAPLFADVAAAQLGSFGILSEPGALPAPVAPPPEVLTASASSPTPPSPELAAVSAASSAATPIRPATAPLTPAAGAQPPAIPAAVPAPEIDLPRLDDNVMVPDFRGHTPAEVADAGKQTGLRIVVSGAGEAVSQDPPPGTVVALRHALVRVRFAAGAGGI